MASFAQVGVSVGVKAPNWRTEWHVLEPKTKRSRRLVPLSGLAVAALRDQQQRQTADKLWAGANWGNQWNLVFTAPDGRPLYGNVITGRFQQLIETERMA